MAAAMAGRSEAMAALRRRLSLSLGGARAYNARPMWRQLGGVYRPDPANPKTPRRHLEPAYQPKLYGRYGAASGVDPACLWPSPRQLAEIEAEERELFPSLREMEAVLDVKEREEAERRRKREEFIAARMAKMPQMIAEWLQEKEKRRAKEEEEKERRRQLLAEARERLGYNVDQRSPEFQEMVQEMEKARRQELKLQKRQRREQATAKKTEEMAAAASAAAVSQPAGGGRQKKPQHPSRSRNLPTAEALPN